VGASARALGTVAEGSPGAGAKVGLVHAREILRAVVGAVLILVPAATAVLVALSLRVGPTATMVVAYVAWVANLALATQILSPLRQVDRGGLAVVEGVLLAGVALWWWRAGRPRPVVRVPAVDAVTALALAAAAVLLAYELVLGLTVPPDNWDAVSYHLTRVAAWLHHGGVYWVPNAPTDRINEFQPLAEQQLLYLFAATGSGRLYALPQFLAELALLVCVYGSARRLGYGVRPSAVAACLFATFGVVAYEATTAQNDLVAASVVSAAAFLLLGSRGREDVVGGIAAGIGLGVKLTTILAWPVLIGLALLRGGRTVGRAALGAGAAFAAVGCWGFVLNLAQTGHVLGHGGGRVGDTTTPSYPASLVTLLSILYTTLDLSVLWPRLIAALAVVGGLAAAILLVRRRRREGADVLLPFLASCLVIVVAALVAEATRRLGSPVRGPGGSYSQLGFFGGLNNTADDDASAFGPVGAVALWGLPILGGALAVRRRVQARWIVLAAALPTFLVLLALQVNFNPWFSRFLIIPAALTAPLLAALVPSRMTALAWLAVGFFVIALGITRLDTKRLVSPYGAPWHLTEEAALAESGHAAPARALAAYDRLVPDGARVGAILTDGDPSYLLGGNDLRRRVLFLPQGGPAALAAARRARLGYVVIADQIHQRPAARRFAAAGWKIRRLAGYWLLAVR
jgi:hypothetical protein